MWGQSDPEEPTDTPTHTARASVASYCAAIVQSDLAARGSLFGFISNFQQCFNQSWRGEKKRQKVGMNDKSQSWYHFSIIAMSKTCDVNNRRLFQGGCRCMCASSLPQPSVSEGGSDAQKAVCQLPN